MKREVATHPDALPRKGNVGNSRGASLMTTLDEGGKKMAKQKNPYPFESLRTPCA